MSSLNEMRKAVHLKAASKFNIFFRKEVDNYQVMANASMSFNVQDEESMNTACAQVFFSIWHVLRVFLLVCA